MIAIMDCGTGNISSVMNAFRFLNAGAMIASSREDLEEADMIVLPGVGAFGFMMKSLRSKGLEKPLIRALAAGKPFLGICLGLQALFEESEESPGVKGLCIFKGRNVRFRDGKVPQIGWNTISATRQKYNGLFRDGYAYFVNSYYAAAVDISIVAAMSDYYLPFISAIQSKNITAVQFHPERSGKYGLELLRRWLECSRKG